MRTKEQIRQALIANLSTSENWQQLQHAIVGKELLAWATEAVYAQESVAQTMVDSLDYNKSTVESLISLCHINDTYTSFQQPGFIRVKIKDSANPTVYPPFSIKATNGSVAFYNVGYCKSGDTILMYQGSPVAYSNAQGSVPFVTTVQSLPESVTIDGSVCYPIDLIPDSVFVFQQGTVWQSISPFSPINYDDEFVSFKHYIKEDKTNVVMLGNANPTLGTHGWGRCPEYSTIAIIGIKPSFTKVSSNQYTFSGTDVTPSDFTVLAFYAGNSDSLDYAKSYYRQKLLSTTVIQSASQLKDYTNAFAYVQDCALDVVVSDRTRIHIYVKPSNSEEATAPGAENINFGEIELALDMHGSILSNYYVTYGSPILYQVNIYTPANTDAAVRNSIAEAVATHLAYENTPYDYRPSVSEIAAFIQSNYQVNCMVMFSITEQLRARLSFIPARGSMKFFENEPSALDNNYKAWDSNGLIYAASTSAPFIPTYSLGLGRSLTNFTVALGGLLHQFAVNTSGEYVADKYLFGLDGVTPNTKDGLIRPVPVISQYTDIDIIINAEGIFSEIAQAWAENYTDAILYTERWLYPGEQVTSENEDEDRKSCGFLSVQMRERVNDGMRFYFYLMSDQPATSRGLRYQQPLAVALKAGGTKSVSDTYYGFPQELVNAATPLTSALRLEKNVAVDFTLSLESNVPVSIVEARYNAYFKRAFVVDTRTWFPTRSTEQLAVSDIEDIDKSVRIISTNGHAMFLVTNINAFEESYSKKIVVFDNSVFWNYPNIKFSDDSALATFDIPEDFPFDFAKPNFDVTSIYDTTPQDYAPLLLYHRQDPTGTLDAHTLIWVAKDGDSHIAVHYGTMVDSSLSEKFVYPLDSIEGNPIAALVKPHELSEDLIIFVCDGVVTQAVLVADYMSPTIHQKKLTIQNLDEVINLSGNMPLAKLTGVFRGCESRLLLKITSDDNGPHRDFEKFVTASDFTYSEDEGKLWFTDVEDMIAAVSPRSSYLVENKTYYKHFPLPLYDRKLFADATTNSANPSRGNGTLNTETRDLINQYTDSELAALNEYVPSWISPILATDDMVVIGILRYQPGDYFCKRITNSNGTTKYALVNPLFEVYRKEGNTWTLTTIQTGRTPNAFKNLAVVGTIDYYTGDLRTTAAISSYYVRYEAASYANITPQYFFMLKNTPNVQSIR